MAQNAANTQNLLEGSLTSLFQQFSTNFMFPSLLGPRVPYISDLRSSWFYREEKAKQREHTAFVLSRGLAPSSLEMWHLACNLFANDSEVAQCRDDVLSTQMCE